MSDDENIYFELPDFDIDQIFNPNKSHCPTCGKLLTTNRTVEYWDNLSAVDKPGYYFVVRQKCLNQDCPFEMQVLDGEAPPDEIRQ